MKTSEKATVISRTVPALASEEFRPRLATNENTV